MDRRFWSRQIEQLDPDRDFAKSKLAGYKCPKIVEFTDALPHGPTGKILTRPLRRPKEGMPS
jgi:acyl-CoA synthetase (AMP-forming)/AMP-acid ligase II